MPDLARGPVTLAGLAAFAFVAAIVRIGDYETPLAGDVTQFLYVGETVVNGGMPYADASYNKGPLTALLFALIDPIVGTSPTAVRLTVVPFVAVAALAIAGYVARHAGRAAGALAGFAFAAFSAIPDMDGAEPKTEHYGLAPMFGALWFAARPGVSGPVAAGALVACAILINPTFVIAIPPVAVEVWLSTRAGERLRRYGVMAAGAAAPIALVCAWLAAGGALDDMLEQLTGKLSHSVSTMPRYGLALADSPPDRINIAVAGMWGTATVGCVMAYRDPRLRRPVLAMALVLGGVLLRVKGANYEYGYQYYPALPALCGVIALGVAAVWPARPLERAAVAALVLVFPLWTLVVNPELELLGKDPNARNPAAASVRPIATFVRTHTAPADPIMAAGAHAEIYWLADRRAPTRFFDIFGLRRRSRSDRRARARDLSRHPPAAIVYVGPRAGYETDLARLVLSGRYTRAYSRGVSSVWLRRGLDRAHGPGQPGP